jgi:hypothetical protein
LVKLQDNVGTLEVASPLYYFMKIINLLVDASSTLEELCGFKFKSEFCFSGKSW